MAERIGLEAVLNTSQFQKGLREYVSGTKQMTGVTQTTAKVLGQIGSTVIPAMGAALIAFGARAIQEGAKFEQSMSNVAAVSGATGKNFDNLKETARGLGATTKFSAIEAADGMGFLAQAGFETNEIIAAMPATLNLAAAGNLDLANAADIVSNVLSGFGANASETSRYVDVLTKTFTTSNTNLQQLGEGMKYVAPVAASLGVSVEDASAAMGVMGNAGIQASMAGTSLRGILLSLSKPTSAAQQTMKELGVSIFDAEGNMRPLPEIIGRINEATAGMSEKQKIAALGTLVNTRQLAAFQVLLREGQPALEAFGNSLRDSGGTAANIAAQQIDNLSGDVAILQSALTELGLILYDAISPGLRDAAQAATEFATVLSRNITAVQDFNKLLDDSGVDKQRAAMLLLTGQTDQLTKEMTAGVVASGKYSNAHNVAAITGRTLEQTVQQTTEAMADQESALPGLTDELEKMAEASNIAEANQLRLAKSLKFEDFGLEAGVAGAAEQQAQIQTQIALQQAATRQMIRDEQLKGEQDLANKIRQANEDAAKSAEQAFKSAISNIESAISSQLKPTLDEVFQVPGQSEQRIDEDARRLATVSTSGFSSAWLQDLNDKFAGQDFFQPIVDAMQSGDEDALKQAANDILENNVTKLWDVELIKEKTRAALQAQNARQAIIDTVRDELIGEGVIGADGGETGGADIISSILGLGEGSGLQQSISDDIVALDIPTVINNALSSTEAGDGTSPILTALGLGEDSNLSSSISTSIQNLGIPTIIDEALSGADTGEGGNPLLNLLGLGEDGIFATAVATLTEETIPSIGIAFTTLFTNAQLGFDTMLLSVQSTDLAMAAIYTTTLPSIETTFSTTVSTVLSGFASIDTKVSASDEILKKLKDTIGKDIVKALESAKSATDKWVKSLERAVQLRERLRPTGGGEASAASGIGFRYGVGFANGTLGFRVPAGFPNDSFPINVTSGERVVVSPPGKSIEQVTGLGSGGVTVSIGSVTIANGMDMNMFENKVSRAVTRGMRQ